MFLHKKSSSILTKEACPPIITAASPVTSGQMSTAPGSEVKGSKGAASKSYFKHSSFDSTSGSTTSAAVCSCQSKWQTKEEQIKALQEKVAEAH